MAAKISKPRYVDGQVLGASAYKGPWLNTWGLSLLAMSLKWAAPAARVIAHNAADAVVASTGTWHFVNGAFTAADKGGTFTVAGASNSGNNGAKIILTVVDGTHVTTATTSLVDETFGGGVTVSLQDLDAKGTFGLEVSDDGEQAGSNPVAPTLHVGAIAKTVTFSASPNADASAGIMSTADFGHHWARLTYTPDATTPGAGLLYAAATGKGF
jgi:hypothetical protein